MISAPARFKSINPAERRLIPILLQPSEQTFVRRHLVASITVLHSSTTFGELTARESHDSSIPGRHPFRNPVTTTTIRTRRLTSAPTSFLTNSGDKLFHTFRFEAYAVCFDQLRTGPVHPRLRRESHQRIRRFFSGSRCQTQMSFMPASMDPYSVRKAGY